MISVIGGVFLTYGGREIILNNRKSRAMVAYLALSQTAVERRERLAGLLWSEFSEQNARATLRQSLHECRQAMLAAGGLPLIGDRTTIGLQPGSFRVDLHDLMDAVAGQEVPDILLRQDRLAEALLAGFDDLDPSFSSWLTARRQTLHDSIVRGLEAGYRDLAMPRWRRRRMAEAVLLLDPTHEAACRALMQCAAEDGEIGAALRAYDELYRLLGDEYDQEPSVATQELVATIKLGKFDNAAPEAPQEESVRLPLVAPRRASGTPPLSSATSAKPALLIGDFAINGVPPERAYLVSGFRIELIACLTRFREWYVSGNRNVTGDDHTGVPISARYLLTTTTYQAGASINVTMVLEEQPSGLAIWGERFELRLDQWFDAQQRIVRRIAATLNVQISTNGWRGWLMFLRYLWRPMTSGFAPKRSSMATRPANGIGRWKS